ncbi:MAG TPA: OmpA family protein, partial [Phycisphaerae bacterium]|nr:OmpA family protein [Phycisphaerae bacterium]
GGCVTKEEYDRLWAMNRKVNDELDKTKDQLRLSELEKQDMNNQLADRDKTITFQADKIANLEGANTLLQKDLQDAKARLAQLAKFPLPPLGPLPGALNAALRKLASENAELMEFDEKNGMVKLKSDLTFGKGSVDLKAEAVAALKKLAEILNAEQAKNFSIYIAGHTDDIPLAKPETIREHKTNWGLASHRAIAVVHVLFDAGIDQARMAALGFSKYHPIEPNAPGSKGNPANRRVEIWIVPPSLLLTQPAAPAGG